MGPSMARRARTGDEGKLGRGGSDPQTKDRLLGSGSGYLCDVTQLPGLQATAPRAPIARPSLVEQFTQLDLYAETLLVLLVAVVLAAVLAYHPSTRRKVTTRAELDQPKTMVLYGLVGALVGHVVLINEMMALVIFGIGGLLRFRTIVGEAKDTGRVILAAIVGICAGLQSFLIAVLATLFGFAIIWYLERQNVGSVQILGLETAGMQRASLSYRGLLRNAGCRVVGETRNPKKGLIELVFTAPRGVTVEQLEAASDTLEPLARGVTAWEIT